MKAESRIESSLTDVAVRAELFYLNLCDELDGRTDVSPDDMQLAFSRALDNTASDMPKGDRCRIELSPADLPDEPTKLVPERRHRTVLIYGVATAAAIFVAILVRFAAVYLLQS